jgi:hypothetical protein
LVDPEIGLAVPMSRENEAMLRTRAPEANLWEAVFPEEVLRLSEELARIDALLDDPAFFAPFVPFFDPRWVLHRCRWRSTCR